MKNNEKNDAIVLLEILESKGIDIKKCNFFKAAREKKINNDVIEDYWKNYDNLKNYFENIPNNPGNAELNKTDIKKMMKGDDINFQRYKGLFEYIYKIYRSAELKYIGRDSKIEKVTPAFNVLVSEKLKIDEEYNIVLLTKNNADTIKEILKNDDNYIPFAQHMYKGISKNREKFKNNKEAIKIVLREIDRDNSTNVWRYDQAGKEAFNKIMDYIFDSRNEFFVNLQKGNKELPDDLLKAVEESKKIKSFCSKVCKYLHEYMYGDDMYYINDKFIRRALPFYLHYYDVNEIMANGKEQKYEGYKIFENMSYKELHDCLDDLREKAKEKHDEEIGRAELDSIIWYCYKSFKA